MGHFAHVAFNVASKLGVVGMVVALVLVATTTGSGGASQTGWSSYLYGPAHTSYNPNARRITASSIGHLQPYVRWIPPAGEQGTPELWASPTVVGNTIYVGAQTGRFFAVRRGTDRVEWSRFLGFQPKLSCAGGGLISTATVERDPRTGQLDVYVFGQSGKLYDLDAATGRIVWATVVDTPSKTVNDYFSWSSPTVANGNVYVGVSSDCDNPLVPAGVVAVDQHTGKLVAQWHSVSPGSIGASVWSSVAVGPDGSVFAATGNSTPVNSAQPLYSQSIVRLNGQTLSLEDYWQLPANEAVTDSDFGASPTLFTADVGGQQTAMVGECNKNGIYYAFRQADLSAGPVWQRRITNPYKSGYGVCTSATIWDGQHLIVGAGNGATIAGVNYQGAAVALDPATGDIQWETGLPGAIMGSPTEDGGGVVAAPAFLSTTKHTGVYFLDASNGRRIGQLVLPESRLFGQPVFAGPDLLVGGPPTIGLTDYEIARPAAPIASVWPGTLHRGQSKVLMVLQDRYFPPKSRVFVSGTGIEVKAAARISPTTIWAAVDVAPGALGGPYSVSVIKPGRPPVSRSCRACLHVVP